METIKTSPNMEFGVVEGEAVAEGVNGMQRLCPHCRNPVIPSNIPGYVWQCLECDEDFFDIECYKVRKE